MGLIVTGTDTEVGKTLVSVLLSRRYKAAYWKPIATGTDQGTDTDTVRKLQVSEVWEPCFSYPQPVSPHLAGRKSSNPVRLAAMEQAWADRPHDRVVVEGIGGVLVPLREAPDSLLVDWFSYLDLPCLVVARTTLGTLNHTLLTIEALRARQLKVAGVVMNGPPDLEQSLAIARFGRVRVVGCLPWHASLDATTLAQLQTLVDPDNLLSAHFP
jgi:dethiobiotin synthase